ncbi:MAG: HAMP domain-containing histidine kinase [Lachnospiraceae bacterium]|jgi:signal transduction histidine kinase|nr:HAMP domain-containing histidine kinase [Lachnospiraceae bacterium]
MGKKGKTYRKELMIIIFLLNILFLAYLIMKVYAPAYQGLLTQTEALSVAGGQEAVKEIGHYGWVSAACLAAVCVTNLLMGVLLALFTTWDEWDREQTERNYAAVLTEKDNEIMQYAKLTSLGRVVTDIIHQWKQPLNSLMLMISNIEEAIREDGENTAEVLELSGEAKRTIRLLSDTISEFRSVLSHEGSASVFDLKEVVSYVTGIFTGRIHENNIECTVSYEGNVRVSGKKNMLIQVLMNLVDNALDAIEDRAEGEEENAQAGRLWIVCKEQVKGITISIRDNGGGIQEADLEKIFRLYYSSKGEKGSGLGLTISRNVIRKEFDGELTAGNAGDGAEFVVFLPRYGGRADG